MQTRANGWTFRYGRSLNGLLNDGNYKAMQSLNHSNDVLLSEHSRLRMAQRSIPPHVVNVLLVIGKREHDHRGALRIHLRNKVAQRKLVQALGVEAASRYRDVYAVLTDERGAAPQTLVTVGRLRRRTRLHCDGDSLGRRIRR